MGGFHFFGTTFVGSPQGPTFGGYARGVDGMGFIFLEPLLLVTPLMEPLLVDTLEGVDGGEGPKQQKFGSVPFRVPPRPCKGHPLMHINGLPGLAFTPTYAYSGGSSKWFAGVCPGRPLGTGTVRGIKHFEALFFFW